MVSCWAILETFWSMQALIKVRSCSPRLIREPVLEKAEKVYTTVNAWDKMLYRRRGGFGVSTFFFGINCSGYLLIRSNVLLNLRSLTTTGFVLRSHWRCGVESYEAI